jgi:hypothetical protein
VSSAPDNNQMQRTGHSQDSAPPLIWVLGGESGESRMATREPDELLTALEGAHRLTIRERIDDAVRAAIWLDLAGGSVATAVLATLVAGLTPLTWNDMMRFPFDVILGVIAFIAAATLAGLSGVERYVIDAGSVTAVAGSPDRSWAIPRTQVATARVSRGTFAWILTLSLRDGTEKAVVLPESMRRILGVADTPRVEGGASRPTRS